MKRMPDPTGAAVLLVVSRTDRGAVGSVIRLEWFRLPLPLTDDVAYCKD